MQLTLPGAETAPSRVLGMPAVTEFDIMHQWYAMTGAQPKGSRKPTPDELDRAEHIAAAEIAKWYEVGRSESHQRFGSMDDIAVILNYWHFAHRATFHHAAYEAGVRDAFAEIAARRGLTIPDRAEMTQRCVCGRC